MPSYRVTMIIGALRPGIPPESVLPAAADATRELALVEASDLSVVAGSARLTVRFMADDAELAVQVAEHTAASTNARATVARWSVTERVAGRWAAV